MIDKYEFGLIVINGKEFKSDIIFTPEGVVLEWWREEGHSVAVIDIEDVIESKKPKYIVIGSGISGEMKVSKEAKEFIKSKGIELIVRKTEKAVHVYNQLEEEGKEVMGMFHLTC